MDPHRTRLEHDLLGDRAVPDDACCTTSSSST